MGSEREANSKKVATLKKTIKPGGVPLRRVNQAYCIATSATVDISKVNVSKIDDAFFVREKKAKKEEFFGGEAPKVETSPERVAAQKAVDDALVPAIKKVPMMDKYLK